MKYNSRFIDLRAGLTLVAVCLLSAASSFAQTTSSEAKYSAKLTAELRKHAVDEFLSQSKNPESVIGKILAKEKEETTDGRNPQGCFPAVIHASDLSFFVISGSDEFRLYADDQGLGEISTTANFLISLPCVFQVHGEIQLSPITFRMKVRKDVQKKRDMIGRKPDQILGTTFKTEVSKFEFPSQN